MQLANDNLVIKVLYVEDDPDDVLLVRDALADTIDVRFQISQVDRLETCLTRLAVDTTDIVLLDLFLADSQGLETLSAVLAQDPRIPVVVLSGMEDESAALEAVRQGAQDYLLKGELQGRVLGRVLCRAIERQRLSEALAASEERTRRIIDNSADGIIVVDQQGSIRFVNPAAERLFGLNNDQLVGAEFGYPAVSGVAAEIDIVSRSYVMAVAELNAVEFNWEGEKAFLASLRDITQRKKAEEELNKTMDRLKELNRQLKVSLQRETQLAHAAEAASRTKSTFLTNISHEIRTPMSGVLGMVELLYDTPLNPEQKDYLHALHGSGERLLAIMNSILEFSSIEAGNVTVESIKFDVREVVCDVMDLMVPRAKQKGLSLEVGHKSVFPPNVVGDSNKIMQVLTHLVDNAIKFTSEGEVQVEVESLDKKPDGMTLKFSVRDTGIGIPEKMRALIFQRFMQADSGASRKYEGAGLGLAICKELVDLMGGACGLESTEGEGSNLWFQIPVSIEQDTAIEASSAAHHDE